MQEARAIAPNLTGARPDTARVVAVGPLGAVERAQLRRVGACLSQEKQSTHPSHYAKPSQFVDTKAQVTHTHTHIAVSV